MNLMASDFSCFGTEPFWGLKITDKAIYLDTFEETKTKEEILSKQTAAGVGEEYAFVVKTNESTISVITGACNDGMSDNIYSHHVIYTNSQSTLYGCCQLSK